MGIKCMGPGITNVTYTSSPQCIGLGNRNPFCTCTITSLDINPGYGCDPA